MATNRNGCVQLRARTLRVQPRSNSQSISRNITGALAATWRSLAVGRRTAWNNLAVAPLNGFDLFVQRNRNLLSIGAQAYILDATPAAKLNPLTGFAVAPVYTAAVGIGLLEAFTVTFGEPLPTGMMGVLSSTPILSPTRASLSRANFRDLVIVNPVTTPTFSFIDAWLSAWGQSQASGTVTFACRLIDPDSGSAAPTVYASTPVLQPSWLETGGATLIIETEGSQAAQLTNQAIQVEGETIAD